MLLFDFESFSRSVSLFRSCGAFFWYVGGSMSWAWEGREGREGRELSTRQECECFKWNVNLEMFLLFFLFFSLSFYLSLRTKMKKKKLQWGPKVKKSAWPALCLWVHRWTLWCIESNCCSHHTAVSQMSVIRLQESWQKPQFNSFAKFLLEKEKTVAHQGYLDGA